MEETDVQAVTGANQRPLCCVCIQWRIVSGVVVMIKHRKVTLIRQRGLTGFESRSAHSVQLRRRVARKLVDRDDHRHAVCARVGHMALQVDRAGRHLHAAARGALRLAVNHSTSASPAGASWRTHGPCSADGQSQPWTPGNSNPLSLKAHHLDVLGAVGAVQRLAGHHWWSAAVHLQGAYCRRHWLTVRTTKAKVVCSIGHLRG